MDDWEREARRAWSEYRELAQRTAEEISRLELERDHYKRMLENERKRAVEKINGT